MKAAIAELTVRLEILENNEPINRAEGNTAQADLEHETAISFRKAIEALSGLDV
jgi:hypothetical protein